jgi:hypothetical protein
MRNLPHETEKPRCYRIPVAAGHLRIAKGKLQRRGHRDVQGMKVGPVVLWAAVPWAGVLGEGMPRRRAPGGVRRRHAAPNSGGDAQAAS